MRCGFPRWTDHRCCRRRIPEEDFRLDAVTLKPLEPIRVKGKNFPGSRFRPQAISWPLGRATTNPKLKDHTVVIWDLKKRG